MIALAEPKTPAPAAKPWTPPLEAEIIAFAKWSLGRLYRSNTLDDADEMLSVALEAIADSFSTFDPSRGQNWTGYAMAFIRWRVHSHRRSEAVRARHVKFVEFCEGRDDREGRRLKRGQRLEPGVPPETLPMARREFWQTALDGLEETDALIVRRLFVDGASRATVAEEVGLSASRVGQRLAGGLERVRRNLNRAGLGCDL